MVVQTRGLSSLSVLSNACTELKEGQVASLVLPSPAEPFDAGQSISFGLKKGTLVEHIKYGSSCTGGSHENMINLKDGEWPTQNLKGEEFSTLAMVPWGAHLLQLLKRALYLEGLRS